MIWPIKIYIKMKSLFKKSIKLSILSLAAVKTGEGLYDYYRRQFLSRCTGKREEEEPAFSGYQQDDIVGRLLSKEFEGDLSKLSNEKKAKYDFKFKNREESIKELSDPKNQYDLLIIGGGANGAGVALEASSRGLKCAVIDMYDFASGTSSKSTKMAHGGIRYFE